ncbi:MAG: molecular chaperone TorD family protein [Rhodobacteraceae bacterium]|nr:molecular chaperone TorD family protein [Paracoccaceae bacterium]
MHRDTALQAFSKRDFWLCMARAFAPPATSAEYLEAFQTALPDDLETIAEEIGLHLGAEIADLRAAAVAITDPMDLQRLYASLFLTPPTPVMVNTGFYLDGAVMGDSEEGIAAAYARHGFERHQHFRDLNDTPAVQAEFLALLFEKAGEKARAGEDIEARAWAAEAEAFLSDYVCRWITPFLRDLETASRDHGVNPAYAHLARLVWLAVEGSVAAPEVAEIKAGMDSLPRGSARGIGALTAEDLAEIAYRLERDGLAWDHVAQNDGWDDAVFAARRARGEAELAAE